jgi:hypothetical protein
MKNSFYILLLLTISAQAQNIQPNYSSSNTNKEVSLKYLASLTELKNINDDNSAQLILTSLEQEIKEGINNDSASSGPNIVRNNLTSLIDAFAKRLEKSQSTVEVDKLFDLINAIIQKKEYDATFDRYIAYQVSEAINMQFNESKTYLGDLLLEGYKLYLKDNELPEKPSREDVKSVYQYIIATSDEISLERNILLAQMRLLSKEALVCNEQSMDKIRIGKNWTANENRLNKIPFLMLNKNVDELIQQSALLDTTLDLSNDYYVKRQRTIKMFNYKLDKFAQLDRISRGDKDLIFDDPFLMLGTIKQYDGCPLIHYISRKDFYTFPN